MASHAEQQAGADEGAKKRPASLAVRPKGGAPGKGEQDIWELFDSFFWTPDAINMILGCFYREGGQPQKASAALALYKKDVGIIGLGHMPPCEYGGVKLPKGFYALAAVEPEEFVKGGETTFLLISLETGEPVPGVVL